MERYKFNALTHKEDKKNTQNAGNLPYILVCNTIEKPNVWTSIKVNKTDTGSGSVLLLITEPGE